MNSGKKRELYFNRKLWIESIFHERDILHTLFNIVTTFIYTHTQYSNLR